MNEQELPGVAAVDRAIVHAVDFLKRQQLPHGEFTTLLGADRAMANPAFDSSPFITAFVLYGLTHVERTAVADIVTKASDFLTSEMEFGGVWRYWSSRQHKHRRLPPDLDDTACISYALARASGRRPKNDWAFLANRDSRGRFKTWLITTSSNRTNNWFRFARWVGDRQAQLRNAKVPAPADEDPRFRVMHIVKEDVDPVLNANVVLYLGERPDTAPAIQFVIDSVVDESMARSLYYEDPLALYYAIARAHHHSSPRLSVLAEPIVSRIHQRCHTPDELNPLQAAMAMSTLLTFERDAELVTQLLHHILTTQRGDGGWDAYPFYNVWGSEELTTALCVEVLARIHSSPP